MGCWLVCFFIYTDSIWLWSPTRHFGTMYKKSPLVSSVARADASILSLPRELDLTGWPEGIWSRRIESSQILVLLVSRSWLFTLRERNELLNNKCEMADIIEENKHQNDVCSFWVEHIDGFGFFYIIMGILDCAPLWIFSMHSSIMKFHDVSRKKIKTKSKSDFLERVFFAWSLYRKISSMVYHIFEKVDWIIHMVRTNRLFSCIVGWILHHFLWCCIALLIILVVTEK